MPPRAQRALAPSERRVQTAIVLLLALPAVIVVYKIVALGYSISDVMPQTRNTVTYELQLDGHGGDARVRTFLPASDDHQQVFDERNQSPDFHLTSAVEGLNRTAVWSGGAVPDGAHISYSFSVLATARRFDLDPDLPVPAAYPPSISSYLRPEEGIQVDAPEVTAALARIGADRGALTERLRRIHAFTSGLARRPFKGTTDALTALRLGEASCNGKSRLFVALARATGIPARLVGGLILEPGSKRTSHQWVEAYVAGHWVPFCPTNGHFAELPERYLALYIGDESLFTHTRDVNFQYRFETHAELVPSPRAKETFRYLNVWAMFERLGLPFALLRTVLMLPIGALVVVLFRNVVGLPTFGTFLPALLAAAAAGETGAGWGVAGVMVIVLLVAGARWLVQRLELLHSPTLAILLTVVVMVMLGTGLAADGLGLARLAHVSIFPIAVLAITAERFYLSLTEHGTRTAAKELAGTLGVMIACYAVMSSLALEILVVGFPEILLAVIAADIYLGRWVGIRVSEYLRFRHILLAPGAGA